MIFELFVVFMFHVTCCSNLMMFSSIFSSFVFSFRIVGGLLICGVVVMHSALTAYLEQSVNGDFLRYGRALWGVI